MALFFTSDPHLGDDRMGLLNRHYEDAADYAENYIANWNKLITPEDQVIVVGDFVVDEESLHRWAPRFNGNKILITGNYDQLDEKLYLQYFDEVLEYYQFSEVDPELNERIDFHVVHYPSKGIAERFNLVGHIHGAWKVQKNMINVGVDAWNHYPIPMSRIFFQRRGIINFYDQDVWVANHPANTAHDHRGKAGTYWERGFGGTRTEGK